MSHPQGVVKNTEFHALVMNLTVKQQLFVPYKVRCNNAHTPFFSVRCELSLNIIHCRLLESSKCVTVMYICDNLVVCGLKVLPLCKLRACNFIYSHACDIQSLTCFFISFVCSRQSSVPLLPTKHQKTAPVAEG